MLKFFNCKDTAIFAFFSVIICYSHYFKNTASLNSKKVVITGGPGTGKSSIINHLKNLGFTCYEEIARDITLEARQNGIDQLFLTKPLQFSQKLLDGRAKQFHKAHSEGHSAVFLDRGIPDIVAYMEYSGDFYPHHFIEACQTHRYDKVFILAPWRDIFVSDSERYENFEEASAIHDQLVKTYTRFGYDLIDVPFESIEKRTNFLLDTLNLK
jgi:predicted ATPase